MFNNLDNIELRSESVQEILSKPPSWMIRYGITFISFVFISVLAISYFIKYPDFIDCKVVITTQVPPEKIEARVNGKLEKFFVKNHQNVNKNAVLACLATNANYYDIIKLKNYINEFKPNEFPIEKTRNLVLGELDAKYILFEKAFSNYSLENKLQPYSVEKSSALEMLSEIENRLANLKNQKKIEIAKLELSKLDLNRYEKMYDKGITSSHLLEQAKVSYLQAQQSLESVNIAISRLYEDQLNVKKGIKNSSISQQLNEASYYVALVQSYDELKNALSSWEQQYLFIASINGEVSFQKYWGENQFVKAGDVVLTILPNNRNRLIGKMTVSARSSGKMKKNQKVLIRLDNYPYQQFGFVEGKVLTISMSTDNEGNYYVEVQLPNGLTTSYNKALSFDKELTGEAKIVTEDLRLIERVFYQFREIFKFQ